MTDNNRPEVLLSAADHWEDVKIRWQIHQYEMNHLMKDLSLVLNALTDRAFYTVTDQGVSQRGLQNPLFYAMM